MIAILGIDMPNIENYLGNCYYKTKNVCGITVYLTVKNCTKILIANLGVSKVYSAVNLSIILQHFCPKAVIFIGNLAGLNTQQFNSIIIGRSALQFDVDYSLLNYAKGEIPPLRQIVINSDPHLIGIAESASIALNVPFMEGLIVSGDEFIADTTRAENLQTTWSANGLDSESGSIAETSTMLTVPFVIVKGVSNYANNTAVEDYNLNKQTANQQAFNVAMEMITLIQQNNFQFCSCE